MDYEYISQWIIKNQPQEHFDIWHKNNLIIQELFSAYK